MADNISNVNHAFAVSLGDNTADIINSVFAVNQSENKIEFSKNISLKDSEGKEKSVLLKKIYTFIPGEFVFKLDIELAGIQDNFVFNDCGYTLRTSPQIGPHYDRKKDRYEYRRFLTYSNGKQKKKMLTDNTSNTYDKEFTWTGIAGKYFSILVKPERPQDFSKIVFSTKVEKENYANAQVMLLRKPVTETNIKDTYYIYIGPQKEKTLAAYTKEEENGWKVTGFHFDDSLSSSGILAWLEAILKWIMEFMHNKLHINWGISIILLTLLLKLILFPLTKKSSIGTLKMQQIQPKMQEIQAKYKDKPEKLNGEMAKLYKEAGYNPMTGCLPLLLQFPVLIAMFNLFNNYFEFRGASFIPGWIPDLSVGDSIFTLGFNIPFIGNEIRLLPLIYAVTQILSMKITQAQNAQNANQMKLMTYGMPILFFFLFYNAPAGLLLYWLVSNIFQLFQQMIIKKMMKEKREEMGLTVNNSEKK
jgi:YidC/Oxa1 family membrane protein insertase